MKPSKTIAPLFPASVSLRGLLLAAALAVLPHYAMAYTPPQMFGVNLSGAEGGKMPGSGTYPYGHYGYDYIYPSQAEFDYYKTKGVNLVRVPIKWERIQHSLNATLDATEMGRVDAVIGYARNNGMQVLIDLHNYNKYAILTGTVFTSYLVSGTNPVTPANLQNVWDQLSTRYASETGIFGYDLMNEPGGTLANWQPEAQAVVNTIRTHDSKHWVVVEGINWAGAQSWATSNSTLSITDSAAKLIYSAHSYWDKTVNNPFKFDGIYGTYAAEAGYPNMGVDCMQPFVSWITSHGYNGFVGEYGVPGSGSADAASWKTVLDTGLSYLKTNGLSGCYWAGGPWMGGYALVCEPYPTTSGTDQPQMSILQKYGSFLYEAEAIVSGTATDAVSIFNENAASQGAGEKLASNAVNDYISYVLPAVPAGTYTVMVRVKTYGTRGTFQLSIDGVNQGAVQDEYGGSTYPDLNLGTKTFSTTADHSFKFTVQGKNASSTGYDLTFDYIHLKK